MQAHAQVMNYIAKLHTKGIDTYIEHIWIHNSIRIESLVQNLTNSPIKDIHTFTLACKHTYMHTYTTHKHK